MASITVTKACYIAGTGYSPGDTATPSFAVAAAIVRQGSAQWTAAASGSQPLPVAEFEAGLPLVTAIDNTPSAGLKSYTTAHIPTGRTFACVVSGVKKIFQLQDATGLTADGSTIISPPDFDATGNNRFLVQIL